MDLDDDLLPAKDCSKCGKLKPLANGFYRNKRKPDGHRSECKDCTRIQNAAWWAANPGKSTVFSTAWRDANPSILPATMLLPTQWSFLERVREASLKEAQRGAPYIPPDKKRCPRCGEVKPLKTGFYRDKSSRDGHSSRCKACDGAKHATWQAANPEKVRAYGAAWASANPEVCKARHAATMAAVRARAREKVFAAYGQWCACCGSTERLTIDHINGDGREHREALGKHGGGDFWRWLIRQNFPPGYQTLCSRCNRAKASGPGCPLDHSGEPSVP